MTLETVYAIHSFEAENDDEIPFQVGEPIIILEKDDLYGDSWWKVRKKLFSLLIYYHVTFY